MRARAAAARAAADGGWTSREPRRAASARTRCIARPLSVYVRRRDTSTFSNVVQKYTFGPSRTAVLRGALLRVCVPRVAVRVADRDRWMWHGPPQSDRVNLAVGRKARLGEDGRSLFMQRLQGIWL